jgi:hypothetical protein
MAKYAVLVGFLAAGMLPVTVIGAWTRCSNVTE